MRWQREAQESLRNRSWKEGHQMSVTLRNIIAIATVSALSLGSLYAADGRRHAAGPASDPKPATSKLVYTADQFEYYLTEDGIAYIRPGVKVKIAAVTDVAAGKKPVVEFYLTDNFDQPLDRLGKITPGPIAPGFVFAKWNASSREYFAYTTRTRNGATNPSADQGGTYTDLELGHYKYTFGTALPSNFDAAGTYTLGVYAKRTLLDIVGKDYFADNVFKEIRPDGGTIAPVWNAFNTATTCNRCHDPIALHGGTRRDAKLCMMCHTSQTTPDASGETFNGKVFFHKLHASAQLPSGKTYVAGGTWHVTYPQDLRNCTTCHEATGGEKDIWYSRPSRNACGSCHDDVNFATGENHPAGKQLDDTKCSTCHVADSGVEFDASIKGAHVIAEKSKQLKGLSISIVSYTDMVAGKKPTVVYAVKNGDGTAVDGSKLTAFSPILAGPTSSYTTYYRETGAPTAKFDAATGNTTYTFQNAIPANATGTWTLNGDFTRNVIVKRADGKADITVREAAINPNKYVSLTSAPAVARRTVVTITQCNACHDRLALHGGQRLSTEECVICHNPTNTDVARRIATAGKPEAISFQVLVHRIHTGEELNNEYTVYGNGNTAHNYNEVLYPGDRRNCAKCHTGNSYRQAAGDPVVAPRDLYSPLAATSAACLSCHDSRDAFAHAFLNTTTFGGQPAEACGVCHGPNSDLSPDKVHAR
jgi:OmcA/MtrC family decaheme c-type cytochrome